MTALPHESELPLAGVRIVELANVVAGPSVGKHLSDFGAEVIKVERPGTGDVTRSMGQRVGERSAWWVVIGRNKRSITLDLKQAEAREAFVRLCATADVLVESQRPGVLERLGLAPEVLRSQHEGLVIVRISGFGQTGPQRLRPGFGTLAEAFSGLAGLTGHPDQPPVLAPTALADEITGLFATWAVMVALYGRDQRGLGGQTIDLSLFESLFSMLGPLPTLYDQLGYVQGRNGSRLPWSSPRNVYASSDGQYFAVSGTAPKPAETILELIGGEGLLADERFSTSEARDAHADELDALVAGWIGEHTAEEVTEAFEQAGVAGVPVLEMPQIFEDPHYRERNAMVRVPDEELGSVALQAPVPRFSDTPGRIAHTGKALGADTTVILEELGYSQDEIDAGQEKGAW